MLSTHLRRDLAMIFPRLDPGEDGARPEQPQLEPPTTDLPRPTEVAARLRAARAPAITGVECLTIEAMREAIALAEAVEGRIVLKRSAPPQAGREPVAMHGSLANIFSSDMIVWVGCKGTDGPIARAIAADQLLASFVPADLVTVRRLRAVLRDNPKAEPMGRHKRIGIVLCHDCDDRVASQWHKLAAAMQHHIRLSVLKLPHPEDANRRGAIEAATWQTGLSLEAGGIDFAGGAPRRCPDLATLQARGAIDCLLDLAEYCTPTPGTAGRMMRIDGIVLWLCDDPTHGAPDRAAAWLRAVREALNLQ